MKQNPAKSQQATKHMNLLFRRRSRVGYGLVLILLGAVLFAGCADKHQEGDLQSEEGPATQDESRHEQEQNKSEQNGEDPEGLQDDPGRLEGEPITWGRNADSLDAFIAQMTLAEKIGQMMMVGVNGKNINRHTLELMESYHVGGFILFKRNMSHAVQLVQFINEFKDENANKERPPLFLSVDQEGGRVLRLPQMEKMPAAQAVGQADDAELSNEVGETLAEQLLLFGMNMNYAPVLDIYSNPVNTVIGDRAYGSTSEVVAEHGVQVMQGMASRGVIPVIKHFPGHGDTVEDSHYDLPVVNKTKAQLQAFEWIPFQEAIDTGADVVMSSHIVMKEIDADYPATLSRAVMTDVLRDELGFSGVVITDDLTMGAIIDHYGIGEAAVLAVNAGNDILLVSHGYDHIINAIEAIEQAVINGQIDESTIDASVYRILQLKQRYHLTDDTVNFEPAELNRLNEKISNIVTRIP